MFILLHNPAIPFTLNLSSGESTFDCLKNFLKTYVTDPDLVRVIDSIESTKPEQLRTSQSLLQGLISGIVYVEDTKAANVDMTNNLVSIIFQSVGRYETNPTIEFTIQENVSTHSEPINLMLRKPHVILFSSKFNRLIKKVSIDLFKNLLKSKDVDNLEDFVSYLFVSFKDIRSYKQIHKNMLQMHRLATINTLRNFGIIQSKVDLPYKQIWISYDPASIWDIQIRYDKINKLELHNLFQFLRILDSEVNVEKILSDYFKVDIEKDLDWRLRLDVI